MSSFFIVFSEFILIDFENNKFSQVINTTDFLSIITELFPSLEGLGVGKVESFGKFAIVVLGSWFVVRGSMFNVQGSWFGIWNLEFGILFLEF